MSDLPKLEWLRVRSADGLEKVAGFVKQAHVNTYSPKTDKNGDPIILMGWDDKPDSDWGRFRGNRAAIWFADEALAAQGEARIREAMGWPPCESIFTPTQGDGS